MKHLYCLLLLCAAGAAGLAPPAVSALPSEVVYTEGGSRVRFSTGKEAEPFIGDVLNNGDTVFTGLDGLVELDQEGVSIRVQPDTVFTLREREEDGKKVGVLALVLGSIRFRYDKLTGREPRIQTNSCVVGVRGTEFTVYSGVDGSSLLVEEGVEIRPGEAPGEKLRVQRDQVDYSKWNEEKLSQFILDPLTGIGRAHRQLSVYIGTINDTFTLYQANQAKLKAGYAEMDRLKESEDQASRDRYFKEVIVPLTVETSNMYLNIRYHSLAALSLRRFVMGRLYLEMKSRYIVETSDERYLEFRDRYEGSLKDFSESIIPFIVEADI